MVNLQFENDKKGIGNRKTAILGGGLSGLTIGYLLTQQRSNFEILEKEERCGGLMRALQEEGFTFDFCGSHIIFSKDKTILHFILNLLAENKVRRKRNTKVLYKNNYVKYPFENGLSDLPVEENFECLNSFIKNLLLKAKGGDSKKPDNLREWFYYTFGAGITEKYLIPYNEKIWKFSIKDMRLDWVERIPEPPVEDIIKSSLGLVTEGYTHQLYFYYPKTGGIESITKLLQEKIKKHVTIDFNVNRIKREGQQWFVSDGKCEKSFDRIVSTIPIQELVSAINAPKDVKAAANGLKYNSLITVMIGLNRNALKDLSWLYIPDKEVLAHRVSFPSNFSPCVAPSGKSSVLAEITCSPADFGIWEAKNEEIIDRVIDDLSKLRIVEREDICFKRVHRTKYAYVINDFDYVSNLNIIKNYFNNAGIGLIGRFSEYKYLNMDACIASAMKYVASEIKL